MIGVRVAVEFAQDFEREQVTARWVAESRPRVTEIENYIERAWNDARGRPGVKLFDGPMCRLERYSAGKILELDLSRTSYKIFWGTNLNHAGFAARFGAESLANAVGLSCALESADGYLLLGRRNASVAYYPRRVHPFAGSLEPGEPPDVFGDVERELAEELGFGAGDIGRIVCIGMVKDISLLQPELVFGVRSTRTRAEIERRVDAGEHEECVGIESRPEMAERAMKDAALTPVALGTVLLWGRGRFGRAWFDAAERAVNLGGHESV